MLSQLPVWLAALWWGSLTTLGFFVVPMLFSNLATPAMAGNMAAKLFTAQTYVSSVCAVGLMLLLKQKMATAPMDKALAAIGFAVAGLLFALLVEYGVAPRIVARDNLTLWHRVGGAMYFLQWLCSAVVFALLSRREVGTPAQA
ncbi:DUF4149 domain-containing protein [Rhodoferax aquaticus]|uniref:DUF4149 domain-containing protein n=1 Tax=Rhodoferax aquaticus TaxID=2527691 RepID=A0A515EVZ8_9BURK|nr:DUF4149 domain-containing protein [Rhodoferax aquaticus]QDL56743.1 DUF4149 domain-containing protein [Rhodoferax aquaticus]